VLARTWTAGADPGDLATPLTIDLDSTIVAVRGHRKQGAAFGHAKVRAYHKQLATCANGQVLMSRLPRLDGTDGRTDQLVDHVVGDARSGSVPGDAGRGAFGLAEHRRRTGGRFSLVLALAPLLFLGTLTEPRIFGALPDTVIGALLLDAGQQRRSGVLRHRRWLLTRALAGTVLAG